MNNKREYKFNVGDMVAVVGRDFDDRCQIGDIGLIEDLSNTPYVDFGDFTWAMDECELELVQESSSEDTEPYQDQHFAIEYDQSHPLKTRGFEKVSLEEFTEALKGTTYEKATQYVYDNIKLPKRGTKHSAGYDIFAPFAFFLDPNETIVIPTGIKAYMQFDEMIAGYPRSSKGFKFFMRLANTVAIGDSDYHDNIKNEGHYFIKIRNEGTKTMRIEMGEAFVQFIFHKYLIADDDSFENGEERKGGIGSTDDSQ